MFNFIKSGKHTFCVNSDLSVVICLHNMVLDLKFCRFEDGPWGFRLTGGSDFELPLTVIKVSKGSIAELTGMKVGDVIVRINDIPASNLSHCEAHKIISACGNTFFMGVMRPDEEGNGKLDSADNIEENHIELNNIQNGHLSPYQQIQTPDSQAYSDMSEMTINTNRTDSRNEVAVKTVEDITDDHIAEMMSGEAEVLKEHNVIGVNFQRIMPKSGLFKSSEVFKHLNEEAMKTKRDKENEVKKWTTFLQKPDRPILKSRADLEKEQRQASGYRVVIQKQPKPRCDPNRPPTPPQQKCADLPPEEEPTIEYVPNLDYLDNLDELPIEMQVPNVPTENDFTIEEPIVEMEIVEPPECLIEPKNEEELLLEKQLSDVQKQLLALSSLPFTIQATLDAVTKQLSELMPALKLQQQSTSNSTSLVAQEAQQEEKAPEQRNSIISEDSRCSSEYNVNDNEDDVVIEEIETVEPVVEGKNWENSSSQPVINTADDDDALSPSEQIEKQRIEKVYRKQEEEWLYKREKEQKRLEEEENKKRRFPRRLPKELGGPLTPQERPLVLPGGRKWRNERDAFNEDFIAEVISSQAELIAGSTMGHTYESPLLGYDERLKDGIKFGLGLKKLRDVCTRSESNCSLIESHRETKINFQKYKKPEKDLSNLKTSEVFKIIHHVEREPRHGIQVRPPKVMAEEDVRNRATPISCL